ncbi:MAG: hypothetical protein ACFCGT_17820 [Sandaracinaceae bacterium]
MHVRTDRSEPELPAPFLDGQGRLLAARDGALVRVDPEDLSVDPSSPPTPLSGTCRILLPPSPPEGPLLRCVDDLLADAPTVTFFRLGMSEPVPLPVAGHPDGASQAGLLAVDGSALFRRGACAVPAMEALSGGEGGRSEDGAGVVGGTLADGADPAEPSAEPWCVAPLAPGATPRDVAVPASLGRPTGLIAGFLVGGDRHSEPFALEVATGDAVVGPTPPGWSDGHVDLEVQPDASLVAVVTTYDDASPDAPPERTVFRASVTGLGGEPGTVWRQVDAGPGLLGIGFAPDGRRGLAVLEAGVRRTADGGATWVDVPIPADVAFDRTFPVRCTAFGCRYGEGPGPSLLVLGWGDDG